MSSDSPYITWWMEYIKLKCIIMCLLVTESGREHVRKGIMKRNVRTVPTVSELHWMHCIDKGYGTLFLEFRDPFHQCRQIRGEIFPSHYLFFFSWRILYFQKSKIYVSINSIYKVRVGPVDDFQYFRRPSIFFIISAFIDISSVSTLTVGFHAIGKKWRTAKVVHNYPPVRPCTR